VRVLVTGAAGFIGRHLVNALAAAGHIPVGIDRRWGQSTADRVALDRVMRAHPVELIVHLGAQCSTARSLTDPVGDFVDNALGTVEVCEASRLAGGIPIVFTSTCKVIPGHDDRVAPLGMSKQIAEDYLGLYERLFNVPYVTLAPSTVYGPGQQASPEYGWVTWFAKAALTGQQIRVAGDGSQSRDILFLDDFVTLLVDIVEHFQAYRAHSDSFDVGGGPANEVSLVGLLNELDYHNTVSVPRPMGDLQRVVSANSWLTDVRGWKPTVGWRDGLARTVEWLKGEIDHA
jgi:nucleoside-diphosphate-sugar epimerase